MDKLEKQIIENREALDRYNPDPGIWKQIQKDQSRERSLKYKKLSGWAALILVLITSSMIFLSQQNAGILSPDNSNNANDRLIETEIYYTSKVNSLIEEASPILTGYPLINRDLMDEIDNLDKLYLDIKRDLKDNVSNDEVIEALIRNYKAKIQILQEMMEILDVGSTDNEKKANYEI
jgi:hypothetical protein